MFDTLRLSHLFYTCAYFAWHTSVSSSFHLHPLDVTYDVPSVDVTKWTAFLCKGKNWRQPLLLGFLPDNQYASAFIIYFSWKILMISSMLVIQRSVCFSWVWFTLFYFSAYSICHEWKKNPSFFYFVIAKFLSYLLALLKSRFECHKFRHQKPENGTHIWCKSHKEYITSFCHDC